MKTQDKLTTIGLLAMAASLIPNSGYAQVIDTGESLLTGENAFQIETGERTNTSNIPLPVVLPDTLVEDRALPVSETLLAPNSVTVRANDVYIVDAVEQATGFTITDYTVDLGVQVDRVPGAHKFAEGIELTDGDGTTESVFVRGSGVRFDTDENELGDSAFLSTTFDRGEEATIGFRNIRKNGGPVEQSGVHFDSSGNLITEDLQNGGDLDFNDGNYLTGLSATAIADIQDIQSVQQTSSVTEDFELERRSAIDLLGFMNENGEYTDSLRFFGESNGVVGATYQFSPIFENNRPTLVNIGARTNFDSVAVSAGVNQFLTSVYRTEVSEQLSDYIVLYPTEEGTGNGQAAYENTGGVIVEYANGDRKFLTQWTVDERYNQETYFMVDEVVSFTSALIPEQMGTEQLRAGQAYNVTYENGVYSIGDIVVISQDVHPQNFSPISRTMFGVEDTLDGQNYVVDDFEGVRIAGTVDHNDAYTSLKWDRPLENVETVIPNRFGIYIGASAEVGFGNTKKTTTVSQTDITTTGQAYLSIDEQGFITVDGIETEQFTETYVVDSYSSTSVSASDLGYDVALGAMYNYGGSAWTETADTIAIEAYTGSESGLRAELRDNLLQVPLYVRADYQFNGDTEVTAGISFSL